MMMRKIAAFAAGVTTWEAIVHFSLLLNRASPRLFGIRLVPPLNAIQTLVPAGFAVVLARWAFGTDGTADAGERMPWRAEIGDALTRERGDAPAAALMSRVEDRYSQLFRSRPRFRDLRLAWHVEHQMLPVIALYRTVEHEEGRDAANAAVDTAMAVISNASLYGPVLNAIDRMPRAFDIVRRLTLLGLPFVTPSSGWSIRVTANDEKELSFSVDRCFYVDVLGALGVPELAAPFCSLDDRRYGPLRAIAFSRTGTIARGATECDFHFVPRGGQAA